MNKISAAAVVNLHIYDWLPDEDSGWVFVTEAVKSMNLLILRRVGTGNNMSKHEVYHSHQSSVANPLSKRSLQISYKKRLMNTYIISTTLLAPCYFMFQPLKGHLQGVRLMHSRSKISKMCTTCKIMEVITYLQLKLQQSEFYIWYTFCWSCCAHSLKMAL